MGTVLAHCVEQGSACAKVMASFITDDVTFGSLI